MVEVSCLTFSKDLEKLDKESFIHPDLENAIDDNKELIKQFTDELNESNK